MSHLILSIPWSSVAAVLAFTVLILACVAVEAFCVGSAAAGRRG